MSDSDTSATKEFELRERLFNLLERENEVKQERAQLIYDSKREIVDKGFTINPFLIELILNP